MNLLVFFAVPGPHYIAVDSSPSQAGENFTASCLINVTAGLDLTPDVINFQWLDSNGMPLFSTPDGRLRINPVRQINEEQFVRDVVISPLLLTDTGNYTCEAAIQGPFITSESIDLDITLVVFGMYASADTYIEILIMVYACLCSWTTILNRVLNLSAVSFGTTESRVRDIQWRS